MTTIDDLAPVAGWLADELAEEFPQLRLVSAPVTARPGPSSAAVKRRLRSLSDRFHGAHAITMRANPIPSAYRIFFRHIGLDPDQMRTPVEEAAIQRLLLGGFRPRNLLDDALLVALMETGVPIWALDRDRVQGRLGIRIAGRGERLGHGAGAPALAQGQLVVADERHALAVLFGDVAPGQGVTPATVAMDLFCVGVAGVPAIHVEEALWTCAELLCGGR